MFGFSDAGTHWWVMAYLFGKVSIVFSLQFKGFTKNRIERLVKSAIGAFVLGDTKAGNKLNPNNGVLLHICLSKQVLVLHNLCDFLHHTYWLIKVNWNTES